MSPSSIRRLGKKFTKLGRKRAEVTDSVLHTEEVEHQEVSL